MGEREGRLVEGIGELVSEGEEFLKKELPRCAGISFSLKALRGPENSNERVVITHRRSYSRKPYNEGAQLVYTLGQLPLTKIGGRELLKREGLWVPRQGIVEVGARLCEKIAEFEERLGEEKAVAVSGLEYFHELIAFTGHPFAPLLHVYRSDKPEGKEFIAYLRQAF